MSDATHGAGRGGELESLRRRNRRLADEKAYLELVMRLTEQLDPRPGLDRMVKAMLSGLVDTLGGTNVILWYQVGARLRREDAFGQAQELASLDAIDDPLALEAARTGQLVERVQDPAAGLLLGTFAGPSWCWAFPLVVAGELVGVIKLENVQMSSRRLRDLLPMYLRHAALVLSNEVRSALRREAEEALRGSETRLRGYVDSAPTGIFVADSTGRYVNVNPAACELVGWSREELLSGMTIADLSAAEDLQAYLGLFESVLRHGQGEFDLPLRRKDGTRVIAALRATVLPTGEVIGFATDVTVSRATQKALAALAGEFTALSGNEFFQAVGRFLTEALSLEYVFVGHLDAARSGVEVAAGWGCGKPLQPFRYALADTPCANVLKRASALHAVGVQALFPNDLLLAQMGIEAYVGASLFDKSQQPMGILVGLGRRPLTQPRLAERLLAVFVDSVGAEMLRTRIERDLRESEARFALFMNALPGAAFIKDVAGRALYGNPYMRSITGRRGLVTRATEELFDSPLAERMRHDDLRALDEGHVVVEEEVPGPSGELLVFETHKFRIPRAGKEPLLGGIAMDVTARRAAERQMREALAVFNASRQGIVTTDPAGRILSVNPAFTAITGYPLEEVRGRRPSVLQSGRHDRSFYAAMWSALRETGRWEGEIWNRRRDGGVYPEWLTISSVTDSEGKIVEYVGMFTDITERKQHEEDIWHRANFDELTGLANRNLFADRLERAIANARRAGRKVGLAFLDLDGFKWINDTLGHDVGDELLAEVARRIRGIVRDEDTVARLGGDEFTVVVQDVRDAQCMVAIGEKLVDILRAPFALRGTSHQLTCSVGITLCPDDGDDVRSLVKNADIAMYKAKQAGKNRYQFYARHMQDDARARVEIEADLHAAIATGAFCLHYQPIVEADSGDVVGAEALLRWRHPRRGLVSPLEFISVAEDCGLIVTIGAWVLREASRQWREWSDAGLFPLRLSVNVSSVQFREPGLVTTLSSLLREFDLPPGALVLEITESVLMDGSVEVEERMHEIKGLGLGYALDDFGTGFSSLSYLKRFPFDVVKIDRSFIKNCTGNRSDALLVEAILNMSHSLGLRVTAEGVEDDAQLALLRELGCDAVQGYLVRPPVPPDEFLALARRRQLLPPGDGASNEEGRFLAALRDDALDVDAWLARLLGENDPTMRDYAANASWVAAGVDLRRAVASHLAWRRRLDDFVAGRSPDDAISVNEAGATDRCELGVWLLQNGQGRCSERLREDHEAFHALAGQIVEDCLHGRRRLARRTLGSVSFRKASRDVVTALIACYRAMRQQA